MVRGAATCGLCATNHPDDQRDNGVGEKQEKQDLRYACRRTGDVAKANDTGNKRDDEVHERIEQHDISPPGSMGVKRMSGCLGSDKIHLPLAPGSVGEKGGAVSPSRTLYAEVYEKSERHTHISSLAEALWRRAYAGD